MSGYDSHFPKPSSNKQKSAPKTLDFLIQLSDFMNTLLLNFWSLGQRYIGCIWMMNLRWTIFFSIFANLIDAYFISQRIWYCRFDLVSSSCGSDENNFLAHFSLCLKKRNNNALLVGFRWILFTSPASSCLNLKHSFEHFFLDFLAFVPFFIPLFEFSIFVVISKWIHSWWSKVEVNKL